jgi:hypothetical protein
MFAFLQNTKSNDNLTGKTELINNEPEIIEDNNIKLTEYNKN